MNESQNEPSRKPTVTPGGAFHRLWVYALALAGLVFLSFWFRQETPRALGGINDFMGIYAGARLVGTPDQFNADAYVREQLKATGWAAPSILYTRLPAFALLLRPLGRLGYRRAYFIWQILSLAAFVAFLILWPTQERRLLVLAACWSFPLFADLSGGQDVAFLLLVLVIAWRLEPSRPMLAGAVLALSALKFHLFLLVPVFLIAQRRWRMLGGVAVTLAFITVACFVAAGPGWVPQYLHFVLQGQTNPSVRAMPNLHGLFEGLPHSLAWEIAGAVLIAIATARIAQRTDFSLGLSAALVGSLLASHHDYAADMLVLLPALLTIAGEISHISIRILCFLLLSPLPFLIVSRAPLTAPLPVLLLAVIVLLTLFSGTRFQRGPFVNSM